MRIWENHNLSLSSKIELILKLRGHQLTRSGTFEKKHATWPQIGVCVCVCVLVISANLCQKGHTVIQQSNSTPRKEHIQIFEDFQTQGFAPRAWDAPTALLECRHVETRWCTPSGQCSFTLNTLTLRPVRRLFLWTFKPQDITISQENQLVTRRQEDYIGLFLSWKGDA